VEFRSERNPTFGGVTPEATAANLAPLFEAVRSSGADVGLALDGDADGFGACDRAGNYVDSHRLFAVLLRHLVEGRGWKGEVVRTVTRTRMIDKLCTHYGLRLVETATGFRHAAERMLDGDVLLGGSESGSFGFKNHLPDRDGVAASLLLLEAMAFSASRWRPSSRTSTRLSGSTMTPALTCASRRSRRAASPPACSRSRTPRSRARP
jgi:phosphomannomutase